MTGTHSIPSGAINVDGSARSIPAVTSDDHVLGPPDAAVELVEYGEFECPHCGRAHFHLKALRHRLGEVGARFVFRHFARDEVHPYSVRAAVAAEAAGAQGRFWEMHDHLFQNQHALEYEDLRRHAEAVGLEVDRFMNDMLHEARHPEKVYEQRASALASGITSTPTFFLNGSLYEGEYDSDSLIEAIGRESGALSG